MGVDYRASLVFGIDFGENYPIDERFVVTLDKDEGLYSEAFGYFLAQDTGIAKPTWEEINECEENHPIDIYEYYDCENYILFLRKHQYHIWNEEVLIISPDELKVLDEEIQTLKVFCEKYGIEWAEPKWCLCSYISD